MFKTAFELRDKIKDNAILRPWLDELRETAQNLSKSDISACRLSDYLLFYKTGDRLKFEGCYFDRRKRLATYALMLFIYRDMSYLPLLEDVIWAICEEFTWVLPAHLAEDSRKYRKHIDLFAAETGNALSEIKYLLSDVLSERVKERIHSEVSERVIEPYLDKDNHFYWEYNTNNWSAVCSGGCAGACFYEGNDAQRKAAIEKTDEIMQRFLSGFSSDGVCMEGYGYWVYGFGFFCYYADLVCNITNGKIDHFKSDRVRTIARFVNGGILRPGVAVSFADAAGKEGLCIGYEHYLAHKYDEIRGSESGWRSYNSDSCYRWHTLLRDAVWTTAYPKKQSSAGCAAGVTYYPGAQWYIKKTPSYIICAKGGDNDEPHNHNDVGSFYIDNYTTQIFADLGCGEYTKDYFSDKRYGYFVCGSQGHNLPIIDGKYQSAGKEFAAKMVSADDNTFEVEFAAAYDVPELKSCKRCIKMQENCIVVRDSFEGNVSSICERFIAREKPQQNGNSLRICNAEISCDVLPEINEAVYSDHEGKPTTVWTLDYPVKDMKFELTVKF